MSTPTYKGPGQPRTSSYDAVTGWLGGLLGGAASPTYKTTPTAPPPPPLPCPPAPPCPPCPPAPLCPACPTCPAKDKPSTPVQQSADHACDAIPEPFVLDACGDAVIPVGDGPITIVIQPRA